MENLIALIALALMEVILGIDNIVFLAIVTAKLPEHQRSLARRIGLFAAMLMRIGLLLCISWLMGLREPIFQLTELGFPEFLLERLEQGEEVNAVSWRDLILIAGGLFLIGKSVFEVHEKIERYESEANVKAASSTFFMVIVQIMILDIIFSLDSVITAVGMADSLWVMVLAIIIAVSVMMVFANPISDFVNRHPSLTMLALSFLILIGVMLVAEGIGTHINKGYIYFAMAFSLCVEVLNLRMRGTAVPAQA